MKTIFITIFEGVESKNILRTDIFKILCQQPDLRLVLFVKNKERVQYHQKEFNDERIIYEVVENIKPKGMKDKFFAWLKFVLLPSETKKLQAKILLDETGNYLNYFSNLFLHWLLGRFFIRRIARFLDFKLVKNDIYGRYFDKYQPDLVLLANLFVEQEIHLLREAKKRKVKTVGFINSWDKVTCRGILRILPDKFIVYNDIVKDELKEFNDVDQKDIFVAGIPQYDIFFRGEYSSREDFFKKIKMDPSDKLIVYAPVGASISDSDWDVLDILCQLNNKGRFGRGVKILVRFPPNDFIDEKQLKKRPHLIFDFPGVRFAIGRGTDWDMTFEELAHLYDTLFHMSLLVCYASSISIDAAAVGKPVINLNFEIKKDIPFHKSPIKYYKTDHYAKALTTGGIRLVSNVQELIEWVNRYLANPSLDEEGRKRLVSQQCQFTDGRSGWRIAKFILSQIS